ncbi:MAG: 50S ribosomal protein L13 [Elusimicrobiales bacterium]|nr:50S ribosomal protein L13 [Elusimicrobiales bacterium]HPO94857.1 50S ribosomal protein L13 [Elusimicrobiales bacterium]
MATKTYLPNKEKIEKNRKWHLIDAKDQVLGRMASKIATLLMGKNKSYYTPNLDCGDFVVVINTDHIKLTGNKEEEKFYFSHSGYAKGAKTTSFKDMMAKDSRKVVYLAVKRMLDENKLRDKRLRKLKLYKNDKMDIVIPENKNKEVK